MSFSKETDQYQTIEGMLQILNNNVKKSGEDATEATIKMSKDDEAALKDGCKLLDIEEKELFEAAKGGEKTLKEFIKKLRNKAKELNLKDKNGNLIDFDKKDDGAKEEQRSSLGDARRKNNDGDFRDQVNKHYNGVNATSDDPAVRCLQMFFDALDKLLNTVIQAGSTLSYYGDLRGQKANEAQDKTQDKNKAQDDQKNIPEKKNMQTKGGEQAEAESRKSKKTKFNKHRIAGSVVIDSEPKSKVNNVTQQESQNNNSAEEQQPSSACSNH